MKKEALQEIVGLIKSFNTHLEQQMPKVDVEVDRLIASRNADSKTIEHYLDTLLSLTTHGFGDAAFIRLLEHYKTIDAEGALFYWNEYDNQE